METKTKHIQKMTGVVVSTKMAKTAVVEVTNLKKHPRYKKYFKVTKRYKAHMEPGAFEVGQRVTIQSTPPRSRDKHWRVI